MNFLKFMPFLTVCFANPEQSLLLLKGTMIISNNHFTSRCHFSVEKTFTSVILFNLHQEKGIIHLIYLICFLFCVNNIVTWS